MNNRTNDNKIGTLVRSARKNAHLTQQQLADKVGVHVTHIATIEQGKKNPSVGLLDRIALATDSSFDWAATPSDDMSKSKITLYGDYSAKNVIDFLSDNVSIQCAPYFQDDANSFPGMNWAPDCWCICQGMKIERWAFDISPCSPALHSTDYVDPQLLFSNFITNVVLSNNLIRNTTKYSIVVPNSTLFNMYLKMIPIPIGNISLVQIDMEEQRIDREVYLCQMEPNGDLPFFESIGRIK